MATTKKTTTSSNRKAKRAPAKVEPSASKKVDYYPNRVPLLAVTAAVSILVLITIITTTNWQ